MPEESNTQSAVGPGSVQIQVAGMSCGHCVQAVTTELQSVQGVTDVSVDLTTGVVTFMADRALDSGELTAAIDEAGFEVVTT